jgi:helicase
LLGKKELAALLRGLFDTDGCVEKKGKISFSSISIKLVEDVQRILLNFGIVSLIRKRRGREINLHKKKYFSKNYFELIISHKKSILLFKEKIGFNIKRKQEDLLEILKKISSNYNYIECKKCGYKIHYDLFGGRNKSQKLWGKQKLLIIELLGKEIKLSSAEIHSKLGFLPYKKEARLNHHFELITRQQIGNHKIWELNKIGNYIYRQIFVQKKPFNKMFSLNECPICRKSLTKKIKNGWRELDFEGDIFWDFVSNVKTEPKQNYPLVYDVVLPSNDSNDHLFVANGFFVHNSAGVNTPADIVIIPSLYRFEKYGMNLLPVREVKQMVGRAGRPKYSSEGKSILISSSEQQKELFIEKYINGEIEPIESKLSIIPILRTHVLALITTNYIYDLKSITTFFEKTLYAHQFQNMGELLDNILEIIDSLVEYKFVEKRGEIFSPTLLGKRVSDLFLDPESAFELVQALSTKKTFTSFSYLYTWVNCMEFSPWMRAPKNVNALLMEELSERIDELPFSQEKVLFEPESLEKFFSALILEKWVNEKREQELFKEFGLAPGLLFGKTQIIEWLSYSTIELSKILKQERHLVQAQKIGRRVKYGVKEELLLLVELKGIGRVRARKLFNAGIRRPSEVKTNLHKIEALLGKQVTNQLEKQLSKNNTSAGGSQQNLY